MHMVLLLPLPAKLLPFRRCRMARGLPAEHRPTIMLLLPHGAIGIGSSTIWAPLGPFRVRLDSMMVDLRGRRIRVRVLLRRGLQLGLVLSMRLVYCRLQQPDGLPMVANRAEVFEEEIARHSVPWRWCLPSLQWRSRRSGIAKNPGAYVMRVHLRDSVTCLEMRCALSFPCVHVCVHLYRCV